MSTKEVMQAAVHLGIRGFDGKDRRDAPWFGRDGRMQLPTEVAVKFIRGMSDTVKAVQRMVVLQNLEGITRDMQEVTEQWELVKMSHRSRCTSCTSESRLFWRREIGATQQLACADCGLIREGIVL